MCILTLLLVALTCFLTGSGLYVDEYTFIAKYFNYVMTNLQISSGYQWQHLINGEMNEVKLFPESDKVKHDEAIDALGKGRGEKAADSATHRVAHADATL